jgi:FtsH-binding integral membrane protein
MQKMYTFNMESSNLISYLTWVCWSCPYAMIYTIMLQWSSQLKTWYTWMHAIYYKQNLKTITQNINVNKIKVRGK